MPRYFFDLHNGDGPLRDEAGLELSDRAEVARETSRILLDIARDEMPATDRAMISVTVRSGERPVSVATLTFANEWLDD
jgi:hypothetical protein